MLFSLVRDCQLATIEFNRLDFEKGGKKKLVATIRESADCDSLYKLYINLPNGTVKILKSDEPGFYVEYRIYTERSRFDTTGLITRKYRRDKIEIDVAHRRYSNVNIEIKSPYPESIWIDGENNVVTIGRDARNVFISSNNAVTKISGRQKNVKLEIINSVVKLDTKGKLDVNLVDGVVKGDVYIEGPSKINVINGSIDLGIGGDDISLYAETTQGKITLNGFENPHTERSLSSMKVKLMWGEGKNPVKISVTSGTIKLNRR